MKKKTKKVIKKIAKKTRAVKHEIVVRVASQEATPTTQELAEPIRGDGQKLTIPKTWLSAAQLVRLVEKTPKNQVYKRPGKGGKVFDYVTVSYMQRVLDYAFGWNWDFEVVEHGKEADHVWVLGKLIVRSPDGKYNIVKTQFGRSEVKYIKNTKDYVDYGNDLKSATSDALKKCASMLGIARDIYGKTDYIQESNRTPHEEPTIQINSKEFVENAVSQIQKETYRCKGIDGKGCQYGTASISKQENDYSMKVFKKPLCRECQSDAKK